MRRLLVILSMVLIAGCGSTATPTPIIVYVTPPAASPSTAAVSTPAPPTPEPSAASPEPTATPAPTGLPLVDLPALSKKVPGATKIRYYNIEGDSPAALVAAIDKACGASGGICVDGGVTSTKWTSRTNLSTNVCTIVNPKVTQTITARLPRWTSSAQVAPELLAWWQQILSHISSDETKLIGIIRSANKKLPKLMTGHPCSKAESIINKAQKSRTSAVDKFYAAEQNWVIPEYTGPGGYGTP